MNYPVKGWVKEYDEAIKIMAAKFDLPNVGVPIEIFVRAMATAESGLDRTQVYDEPEGTNDSVGLMQLSPQDAKNYKFPAVVDSQEDLKNPILNLGLAVWMMGKLHIKHPDENIYQCWGRYWSVLRDERYWPGKKQSGFIRFKKALAELSGAVKPVDPPKGKVLRDGLVAAYLDRVDDDLGLREPNGSNRSASIDEMNKWSGGGLGAPYCITGALHRLMLTCKKLGLAFPIRPEASTQRFFNLAPAKYKRTVKDVWLPGYIGIYVSKSDSSHGHAVILRLPKAVADKNVYTYEYNTGPDGGRDGPGFFAKTRSINGTTTLKFRGAVDVIQWILDANP